MDEHSIIIYNVMIRCESSSLETSYRLSFLVLSFLIWLCEPHVITVKFFAALRWWDLSSISRSCLNLTFILLFLQQQLITSEAKNLLIDLILEDHDVGLRFRHESFDFPSVPKNLVLGPVLPRRKVPDHRLFDVIVKNLYASWLIKTGGFIFVSWESKWSSWSCVLSFRKFWDGISNPTRSWNLYLCPSSWIWTLQIIAFWEKLQTHGRSRYSKESRLMLSLFAILTSSWSFKMTLRR